MAKAKVVPFLRVPEPASLGQSEGERDDLLAPDFPERRVIDMALTKTLRRRLDPTEAADEPNPGGRRHSVRDTILLLDRASRDGR